MTRPLAILACLLAGCSLPGSLQRVSDDWRAEFKPVLDEVKAAAHSMAENADNLDNAWKHYGPFGVVIVIGLVALWFWHMVNKMDRRACTREIKDHVATSHGGVEIP